MKQAGKLRTIETTIEGADDDDDDGGAAASDQERKRELIEVRGGKHTKFKHTAERTRLLSGEIKTRLNS